MYRAAKRMVQNQICANIIQTKLFSRMKQNQKFERELNSWEVSVRSETKKQGAQQKEVAAPAQNYQWKQKSDH